MVTLEVPFSMKLRALLLILLLGFGWMLNSLEDHLCSDTGSSEIVPVSTVESSVSTLVRMPSSETEDKHQGELCHFGHCSHGSRFTSDGVVRLPRPLSPGSVFFPYAAGLLAGETISNLRPPAFA